MLVVYGLIYARFAGRLISFPFGWDQGEGTDAWSAWLIAQGQLPYSHNGTFPYFSINYPPLWSALVSLPMAIVGPSLAPARAFASLVTVLDTVLIGTAAWRLSRASVPAASASLAGILAAGLFLASPYVFHTTALSRLNSTLILFSLLALTCLEHPTSRRLGLCILCLLAGAFTKPTGLFTAVACLGWLIATRRGLGLIATGVFAAAAGGVTVVLSAATSGAFWLNVVSANTGAYDPETLARYLLNFASVHPVLLTFACSQSWYLLRTGRFTPWIFALGTALIEALFVIHPGAGESYFLNAIAVASILAGAGIARIAGSFSERPMPAAHGTGRSGWVAGKALGAKLVDPLVLLGALLFVQSLLMAHGPLSRNVPFLPDRGVQAWILGREPSLSDRAAGEEIVELMRANPGPVLSEEPSFALVAGRPPVASANHLRDLDDKGLWDARAMVADIEQHRFGLIVLNAQRYPPEVLAAIGRSYYVTRAVPMGTATYLVFLPGA